MKKSVLGIIFYLCFWGAFMPLHAQKNLLPAVRASVNPARAVVGVGKNPLPVAERLVGQPAAGYAPAQPVNQATGVPADISRMHHAVPLQKPLSGEARSQEVSSVYQRFKKFLARSFKTKSIVKESRQTKVAAAVEAEVAEQLNNRLEKEVLRSFNAVLNLWGKEIGFEADMSILKAVLCPSKSASEIALKTNQLCLFFIPKLADKVNWLRNLPAEGRQQLFSLYAPNSLEYLSARLAQENLIFIGEIHHIDSVQDSITKLIVALKKRQPNRKIVLFSEFINLPARENRSPRDLATYYRRITQADLAPITEAEGYKIDYAPFLFFEMLYNNIEVCPLEDSAQLKMFDEASQSDENISVFTTVERNKTWARVIEAKMAQVRKTDPDALFVVYAGMGHTSWIMPYSLPKFFARENPAVVEVTKEKLSSFTSLRLVWGENDVFYVPFPNYQLHHWRGENARLLGRQTGFDYALVVP